jgi:hypothetical protein
MLLEVFGSPSANMVGLLVGLLGISLSAFFYIKGRKVRRISYVLKSFLVS